MAANWQFSIVRTLEDFEESITRLRKEMEIAVLQGYPLAIGIKKVSIGEVGDHKGLAQALYENWR